MKHCLCIEKRTSADQLRLVNSCSWGKMVITIIIAIVHQHATKDSQELLIFRLSILGEGFNVFSYYLSPSCQVNCTPALICKTKRPGHKSTTKQIKKSNEKKNNHNLKNTYESMLISSTKYTNQCKLRVTVRMLNTINVKKIIRTTNTVYEIKQIQIWVLCVAHSPSDKGVLLLKIHTKTQSWISSMTIHLYVYVCQQNTAKALSAKVTKLIYFVATKNLKSTQSTTAKIKELQSLKKRKKRKKKLE